MTKALEDCAHRDRPVQPTTILLCKSKSSQAALVPKDHKVFMEEAYNAGDHQPWDSAREKGGDSPGGVRFQQIPPCPSTQSSQKS
jgi:hypothetical protein